MTVKELISKLLDMPMNAEVSIYDPTPHETEHGICKGYCFGIDDVTHDFDVELRFTDWRKKMEPKTIDKYVEDTCGYALSKYQRDFITAMYEYYKAHPFSKVAPCVIGNSMTNIMPFLAVVFAAYEENELY